MAKVIDELHSRPPLERMLHIHNCLQSGKFPNCPGLAKYFEVSSRTIKRDLDFMRLRLNLPIEYDSNRLGFFYSRPVEYFPNLPITEAEVFALMVAQKAIAQYHGTPFQRPLEQAFRKLTGQLDRQGAYLLGQLDKGLSFHPFAPEDADLEAFEILHRAVTQKRAIKFRYRNLGAEHGHTRRAFPYHLACVENHWYLFAFDYDRKAMRTFALTRLSRLEITGPAEPPLKDFNVDERLRGSLAVFKGEADYEVVVEFDRWAADQIRGRRWHPTQELTELSDGTLRMKLRLNSIEEMEKFILAWGIHATVVRPEALVVRMHEAVVTLSKRYAPIDNTIQGRTNPPQEKLI